MPRPRVKSLYGSVLPLFPGAARLSGAVGDRDSQQVAPLGETLRIAGLAQ